MSRGLITYLNAVIKAAAEKAGVAYIDVEDSFAGHRLCEDGAKAVNGLSGGKPHWNALTDMSPIEMESFHPNKLGHQLLAESLLSQSGNLTYAMPTSNASKQPPYKNSYAYNQLIGNAPSSGGIVGRTFYAAGVTAETVIKASPAYAEVKGIFKANGTGAYGNLV